MTKREALKEARRRWGTSAFVDEARRSTTKRVGSIEPPGVGYVRGVGDSWEGAFADADVREGI